MQEAIRAVVHLSKSVTEPVSTWVREKVTSDLSCGWGGACDPTFPVWDPLVLWPTVGCVPGCQGSQSLTSCGLFGTAFATVFFRLGFGDMVAKR